MAPAAAPGAMEEWTVVSRSDIDNDFESAAEQVLEPAAWPLLVETEFDLAPEFEHRSGAAVPQPPAGSYAATLARNAGKPHQPHPVGVSPPAFNAPLQTKTNQQKKKNQVRLPPKWGDAGWSRSWAEGGAAAAACGR